MALELNGTTGVSLVQDGVVTAADLASTLDLSGKTVSLPYGTGGKVLQVVHTHTGTNYTSASTSYVNASALDTTITPTSASSKFFIIVELNMNAATNDYIRAGVRILENGSTRADDYEVKTISVNTSLATTEKAIYTYLASPNTTNTLTYSVQFRRESYTGSYGGNIHINTRSDSDSRMTVMEIAG